MGTPRLRRRKASIFIKSANGDFNEYGITEDKFKELQVREQIKYILENHTNQENFITHFIHTAEEIGDVTGATERRRNKLGVRSRKRKDIYL